MYNPVPEFDFTPDQLIYGEKSFPAAYSWTPGGAVHIDVIVDGETCCIEVEPADEVNFARALRAMHAAMEASAAKITYKRRETVSDETEIEKENEAMKNARLMIVPVTEETTAPQPINAAETICAETETTEAPEIAETVTETAAVITDERHETISDEAPAADPKATRGPVPEKDFVNDTIKGAGWSIVFDEWNQRTRVVCTDAIRDAARPIIEAAGFYYSPRLNSWNKKLTHRAHRAALALADQLSRKFAA